MPLTANITTWLRIVCTTALLAASVLALPAYGAIYINKTRLIINEAQPEVSFIVRNEDRIPVLLQTWLDKGDPGAKPEAIRVPFIITPTLFRSEPGRSHTFRVLFTGEKHGLPADREQVYWLNVFEIPPKPKSTASQIQLQMAFRSRIKVFYRPAALKQVDINHEVTQLRAGVERSGSASVLRIDNPGPLHITFISLKVNNGPAITQIPQDGMIAPFSSLRVPISGTLGSGSVALQLEYLNDYGEIQKTSCCTMR